MNSAECTRYETSLKIAAELQETAGISKFSSVIIASGTDFPDALTGSCLAAQKQAPILLTDADESHMDTVAEYIRSNIAEDGVVYILGGSSAVSSQMEEKLTDCNVVRLKGSNRYLTNLEILKEADCVGGEILISTGVNYADSLSVSSTGLPVFLVGDILTQEQREWLDTLDNAAFTIIGGDGAVSTDLETELAEYGIVSRVSGSDRFTTSTAVAKEYFEKPDTVVLTYALNYPDGLCAGPLAYSLKAPVILSSNDQTEATGSYTNTIAPVLGYVTGGTILIDDDTIRQLFNAYSVTVTLK